jgi:hypothetical protein
MPHKAEHVVNYVRKHFPGQKIALSMKLNLPGMDCKMGWRPRLIPV